MKDVIRRETFIARSRSREEREAHSISLDRQLGFDLMAVELDLVKQARILRPDGYLWSLGQGLHNGSQTWVGLDPQVIQTPYDELVEVIDLLKLQGCETVVDLGAGYGRMGIVLAALFPKARFLGLELVPERVREGLRIFEKLGLTQELVTQDLTAPGFILPEADIYFLYDFGELAHIRKILEQLPDRKKFRLVARGKGSQGLIDYEFPWLSDVHPVIRSENFAIYSTFA